MDITQFCVSSLEMLCQTFTAAPFICCLFVIFYKLVIFALLSFDVCLCFFCNVPSSPHLCNTIDLCNRMLVLFFSLFLILPSSSFFLFSCFCNNHRVIFQPLSFTLNPLHATLDSYFSFCSYLLCSLLLDGTLLFTKILGSRSALFLSRLDHLVHSQLKGMFYPLYLHLLLCL